ncbi:hypothetical protein P175DRAFT_0531759 [Aspergillus ochraceoroseus IBT 24754]|uniref:Uncharacterized protein n=1 Tax=Aspergillus ochraceoroseus IBT 24754 TaxID=1392256 RepID=A0A2T5M112_9EURO|nr:uncharacterized protein P175DRAFT_0531759 [Aspergillus ochraceoroseus IBT 24754]PTU22209.1 hypothetical protein P175DRAFT_0531759 [Aspergillus ochraceoroseus IBT 24754]
MNPPGRSLEIHPDGSEIGLPPPKIDLLCRLLNSEFLMVKPGYALHPEGQPELVSPTLGLGVRRYQAVESFLKFPGTCFKAALSSSLHGAPNGTHFPPPRPYGVAGEKCVRDTRLYRIWSEYSVVQNDWQNEGGMEAVNRSSVAMISSKRVLNG